MRVKDIMTANIAYCTPDMSLSDVARLMEEDDCGSIPVLENQKNWKPIGIITDRDITIRTLAHGKNPLKMKVKDIMAPKIITIEKNAFLNDCYRAMVENQIRRIIVIDEDGRCCGIVSQADIATKAPDIDTASVVERISQPAVKQ
jgi:CBS domain-containing protein